MEPGLHPRRRGGKPPNSAGKAAQNGVSSRQETPARRERRGASGRRGICRAGNGVRSIVAIACAAFPGPALRGLESGRYAKIIVPSATRPGPAQAPEKLMSSELIKHVTDDSFGDDVLQSDKPVLVDYWAEWCGPCKMIAPILAEAATQYGDRLQVAKMNVDENREIPAKFGIRGIPTLMLFKDGQLAATKVGALSKAQLTAFLDGHL
jgi:thioredoxin 1